MQQAMSPDDIWMMVMPQQIPPTVTFLRRCSRTALLVNPNGHARMQQQQR
jgi:hypothetical protein